MKEYIFDPAKCPVPSLERIVDVPMIEDCEIINFPFATKV